MLRYGRFDAVNAPPNAQHEDVECLLELEDRQSCVSALTTGTQQRPNHTFRTASGRNTAPKLNPTVHEPTIHGRQQELDGLLDAYTRIAVPRAKSEVIFLYGEGGCGKTCLAEAMRGPISRRGGYFVNGKFDASSKLPYPALVEAFTDLCDLIAQSKGFGRQQQFKMMQKIGVEETRRLGQLLGNLHRVTGDTTSKFAPIDDHAVATPEDDGLSTVTTSRYGLLLWSLQKFLNACASAKHPICLFLDDLQFADQQSLQLIQGLVSDAMSRNILFVLVYRNDMDHKLLRNELLTRLSRAKVTEIQVLNLGLEAVNKIIAHALKTDTVSTMPLAEVVLRKTHGHPYCVLQYIEILIRDGFVTQSQDGGWVWDMARIQCETDVTTNVANIVTDKIQRCHKYVQLILKVASAIGFEFDRKLLETVIIFECASISAKNNNRAVQNFEKKIHKYLAIALSEGLIEKTGYSGKLKFSHIRVKECVYSLIPDTEARQDLHYRIGICVQAMLPKYQNTDPPDWMVYAAAEQLNRASRCRDPLEHLHLNLRAAKLAQLGGAFLPAAEFLRIAQTLIDQHTLFSKQYGLARNLYTLVAEVEYAVGDFQRAETAARLVFQYAKSPDDKMGTFRILVDAMDSQGRGHESVQIALSVLQEFGEKFPSKPKAVNVIMELMKVQHILQGMSDNYLVNLPAMTDERRLNVLKVISVFGTMTPLVGTELIALLSTLRIVQQCLLDGIAPITTHAFASFGVAMAMTGHPNEAYRFGNIALTMLKRFDVPSSIQAHTLAVVHGGCYHWKQPYKDSLQPLMQAYEKGMAVGDVKFSLLAAHNYLVGSLESGVALSQVEIDMRTFCEGLDDMSLNTNSAFRTMIGPAWQLVLNFLGKSENPTQLTGVAMDEETFVTDANTKKFTGGMLAYTKAKLMLAYHFDNLHLAEQLVEELEKDERMVFWHFTVYQLKMLCCLTFLHLAEQTGNLRYHSKALQILEKLENWMNDGNVNCRPIVLLLRAELAALTTPDPGAIKHNFDSAILEASLSGLLHVEALANERAAMACFRVDGFREGAAYVMQACQVYSRWGAHTKVDHLETKFHLLFQHNGPTPMTSERPSINSIAVRHPPSGPKTL